jgi:hypothetical protein
MEKKPIMEQMHFSKLEENLGYGVCLQEAE